MTGYDRRYWILAAGMAGVAGYVDAIGFLKLGGLFVSFMSGNTTRLAIGTIRDPDVAWMAGRLILAFVAGVMAGTLLGAASGTCRKVFALVFVSLLLATAAASDTAMPSAWTTAILAAAMGAANTTFQRAGEVSIGVTYMTGTLVKFAQRLTLALLGGARWSWIPYLLLWLGLIGGAVAGAAAYLRFGSLSLWAVAAVVLLLAAYAALLGPADSAR